MSTFCCCRGLLSLFGVREYPLDVVAKTKLDRAKMNRAKQNDYSTMADDVADGKNGSVVNKEPQLSDTSRASSHRTKDKRVKRKPSSRRARRARKKNTARSYDDSDSDSSVDSAEENMEVMRKSMRNAKSLGGSRETLGSVGSRGSRASEHFREVELEDEVYVSPKLQSPRHQSPHQLSPQSQASTPRRSPIEEDLPETIEERIDEEELVGSPDEERRKTTPSPEYEIQEEGAAAYVYERPVTPERLSPKFRASASSSGQFQRRAVRKVSPQSSPRSLKRSATPSSSKWEVEDAGSIYRRPQSSAMGSDDDELALAREASIGGEHSTLGSDEEYEGEASLHGMEPISACGTLDVAVQYSLSDKKLQVTIIEAHDLPSKARGGSSIVQVRAVLLPAKKKKYKTKVQHIGSPRFAETFKLTRATPEDLKGLALRLRMYGIGKLKDRLIGEAIIRFDELNLIRDPQLTIQLQLEPRTDINRVGSESSLSNIDSRSSSMMSLSHGGNPPEILIGLSYNAPTGRLCVEIIKGSHFRNLAMAKPPDTFVKLSLLNSACQEMSASKTSIRRGQPNPVFKEPFFFQVALFQLSEVTLMVSVYNKRTIKKKEMIGWVAMGRNSSSEPDEQHWIEMKEGKGQQVCRWHPLIDT